MKAFFGFEAVGRKEAAPSRPSRFAVALRASLDRSSSFRRGLLKQERQGVRWQAAPAVTDPAQPQNIAQ
ncbi:hypothetical protein [Phyllobacterium leguminum]|uniref:hypothetical protein n=1 Tax=Phyllobacterium leguminum TaxID=314237 RepID=UPI000DA236D5|nr:hypothetical protein [Phyllobacterium leguminum]